MTVAHDILDHLTAGVAIWMFVGVYLGIQVVHDAVVFGMAAMKQEEGDAG